MTAVIILKFHLINEDPDCDSDYHT